MPVWIRPVALASALACPPCAPHLLTTFSLLLGALGVSLSMRTERTRVSNGLEEMAPLVKVRNSFRMLSQQFDQAAQQLHSYANTDDFGNYFAGLCQPSQIVGVVAGGKSHSVLKIL